MGRYRQPGLGADGGSCDASLLAQLFWSTPSVVRREHETVLLVWTHLPSLVLLFSLSELGRRSLLTG